MNKEDTYSTINHAVNINDIDVVKALLNSPNFYCEENYDWILQLSIEKGYFEITELLLNHSKVHLSQGYKYTLTCAASSGNIELFNIIYKNKKITIKDLNLAFCEASKHGRIEIIKLLLIDPKINPTYLNNWSIIKAHNNYHLNVLQLLWQDTRVKNTLKKDCKDLYDKITKEELKANIIGF
jgi:ankyrin repeat protein